MKYHILSLMSFQLFLVPLVAGGNVIVDKGNLIATGNISASGSFVGDGSLLIGITSLGNALNVDIDSGNIDGAAIGVATASIGKFTTLETTGTVGISVAPGTEKLKVGGDTKLVSDNPAFFLEDNVGTTKETAWMQSTEGRLDIGFSGGGTKLSITKNNHRVGIGHNNHSPDALLDVAGTLVVDDTATLNTACM